MNTKFELEEMIERDLVDLDTVRKASRRIASTINALQLKVRQQPCPSLPDWGCQLHP